MEKQMKKQKKTYKVILTAFISIDDPQVLDKLIIGRMINEAGEETVSLMDDDFEVIEYSEFDFEEIIE